jgi:hypothetical protein
MACGAHRGSDLLGARSWVRKATLRLRRSRFVHRGRAIKLLLLHLFGNTIKFLLFKSMQSIQWITTCPGSTQKVFSAKHFCFFLQRTTLIDLLYFRKWSLKKLWTLIKHNSKEKRKSYFLNPANWFFSTVGFLLQILIRQSWMRTARAHG